MKRKSRVHFVGRSNFRPGKQAKTIPSTSTDGVDCPKTLEYKSFLKLIQETERQPTVTWKDDKGNTCALQTLAEEPVRKQSTLSEMKDLADNRMNTTLPMSLKPMEPHRLNGGTFYSKRRNLVKLAASVLSLEEREVNIKGGDVVISLLHRLKIKKKYEDGDEIRDDLEYPLVTYPEEQQLIVKEISSEANLSSCWWKKYDKISPLSEHSAASDFPRKEKVCTVEPTFDREIFSYSEDQRLIVKEVCNEASLSSCWWKNHDKVSPLSEHSAVSDFQRKEKFNTEEPRFDREKFTYSDGIDNARDIHSTSESHGNNQANWRTLTLYNHWFSGIYSNSPMDGPSQHLEAELEIKLGKTMEPLCDQKIFLDADLLRRDSYGPLQRWDVMDDAREILSAIESQGNNEKFQRPLTLYSRRHEGINSNLLSQPEFSWGQQWENYQSSDIYKEYISCCKVRSTSGRLLLGSADSDSGIFANGRSSRPKEIGEKKEDEECLSLEKWMTQE